jgi:hypothetical protein
VRGIHVVEGPVDPGLKLQLNQGWNIRPASVWDFMEADPVRVMM